MVDTVTISILDTVALVRALVNTAMPDAVTLLKVVVTLFINDEQMLVDIIDGHEQK